MSEQDRLAFWTKALNFPEFRVVHEHRDTPSDPVRFTVVPKQEVAVCPQCGHACDNVHRRHDSNPIKDLPLGEQAVNLIVRTPQFRCERCASFFTPTYSALAPDAHATQRFLAQAAKLIRFSDIANVATYFGVAENTLTRWYYDYVFRQQKTPPANLKPFLCIGSDELSKKKKHRQEVAVIVDHTNRRVLDDLLSRDKECIVKYSRQQKENGFLSGVEEVTCDRWDAYANAATEVFGEKVRVVIDRFHVMKNFQEQLTDARREIQRTLGKEEAKALTGTRWLWVKNWENLTEQERGELEELKKQFPLLKQLAEQRESLRCLFLDKKILTAAEGRKRLEAWREEARKLGLKALERFSKTLTNWMDKIANYFVTRSSNGRTEGFNHGPRSILWRAFGRSNFTRFRLRVLDRFGRPATT